MEAALFLQASNEPDVSVLIQYGAVGLLALLAIAVAVYVTRKYETQTSRFIAHLESTAEKQQHAAIQQASAAHLMASAGERQSESSLAMAKQLEINNHVIVELKRGVDGNNAVLSDLKRAVDGTNTALGDLRRSVEDNTRKRGTQ